MPSFNKAILIGNLTSDPELRQTQSGTSVCRFSIAVNRRLDSAGERKTDFFDIVAWRQSAEFVRRYFSKGKPIVVCGRLQNNHWTDQQGNKRYSTEIIAEELAFAESAASSQQNPESAAPVQQNLPEKENREAYASQRNATEAWKPDPPTDVAQINLTYMPTPYTQGIGKETFENLEDDEDLPF